MTAPFSLSPEAYGGPVTGAGLLPVWAYVQTPDELVRVEAEAVWQTPDAVLVRFGKADGYPLQAWVWRSAVKHRRRLSDMSRSDYDPQPRPRDNAEVPPSPPNG